MTHGPCKGWGDSIDKIDGCVIGSDELTKYVKKIKPKYYFCCDCHAPEGYGVKIMKHNNQTQTIIVNCSLAHTNARYLKQLQRGPFIVDIPLFHDFGFV